MPSIDVDGIDLGIWRALSIARPRLVVIEYNAALDPAAALVQPLEPPREWDGTDFFGASLGALRRVGREKGYRLVHTDVTGVNAFFVREDLAAPFPRRRGRAGAGAELFLLGVVVTRPTPAAGSMRSSGTEAPGRPRPRRSCSSARRG